MKAALLVLDLMNDLVHEEGSVGQDGFYSEACKRQVVANTALAIQHARSIGIPVIYVIVGFSQNYPEWSARSKLFQNVKKRKQIILGTWATQVHEALKPKPNEVTVVKNRIDPFYNTNLETILRSQDIDTLYLTGVSTEFVILTAVMSGHDRGYNIKVISECVSSSSTHSHECAMSIIQKVAEISSIDAFIQVEKTA